MDVIQRKRTIGSIILGDALVAAVGALLVACGGGQTAATKSASATVQPVAATAKATGTPAIPADECHAAFAKVPRSLDASLPGSGWNRYAGPGFTLALPPTWSLRHGQQGTGGRFAAGESNRVDFTFLGVEKGVDRQGQIPPVQVIFQGELAGLSDNPEVVLPVTGEAASLPAGDAVELQICRNVKGDGDQVTPVAVTEYLFPRGDGTTWNNYVLTFLTPVSRVVETAPLVRQIATSFRFSG
jgi:hypothetical protein